MRMGRNAVPRRCALSRVAVSLTLALLGGCSCCNTPFQSRRYIIGDATAMQTGPSGFPCIDVCTELAAGRADLGPDARLPDAGYGPPVAPASYCFLQHGTGAWTLTCEYGMGCPR